MFLCHVTLEYSLIFYKQLHFESMARSWVIITTFKVKVSYKVAYNYNKLWSRDYAYINNLCSVFHYRTIGHLFENILKKFHCIRLNIEGYTAVPASVILLLYKRQQQPPMSNYYQTANMTFWGILKKDTSVSLSCYTRIQFNFL